MNPKLERASVLVLNRNWQPINTRTPMAAFCQMVTGVAQGLRIDDEMIAPLNWGEWIELPVREEDESIATPSRRIRIPTVIIVSHYSRMPRKRLKFSFQGIWLRDQGRCQYTGRELRRGEGNVDHVVPRSRGGATTWENCVLSSKEVNTRKADRMPEEIGLTLQRQPTAPPEQPASAFISRSHGHQDWKHFLKH